LEHSPINTYGNRGLAKPGFTKEEVRSHTIIHMAGSPPAKTAEMSLMTKMPIIVNPSDSSQKLSPMSRLNFGKVYTVEHNIKVMDIGKVDTTSMPYLVTYFNESAIGQ
jgi:hypothetical protein